MSQPRIVRTAGGSFETMAFVVAVRGDLATSRSTDARAAPPGRISDCSTRSPNARTWEALGRRLLRTQGETKMRAIFIAALVGLGIGLVGMSPSLAAPVSGAAIAKAANLNQAVDQVYWRRYYHRHWWWRHHWHYRWWQQSPHNGPGDRRPGPFASSDCRARVVRERGDEARACVGKAEPARLEHVTRQEEAGQHEAIRDVLRRRIAGVRRAQKRRQQQQPGLPWLARLSRHGAARFRRHIDQIVLYPARRAGRKIETKAELREQQQLEAHDAGPGAARIDEAIEYPLERGMALRVRVALG